MVLTRAGLGRAGRGGGVPVAARGGGEGGSGLGGMGCSELSPEELPSRLASALTFCKTNESMEKDGLKKNEDV